MTFWQLFWEHLTHREMRLTHLCFVLGLVLFLILQFAFPKGLSNQVFLASVGFLTLVSYQQPLFFALAKIAPDVEKPSKEFAWATNWYVVIGQQALLLAAITAFLQQTNNPYWPNIWWVLVPVYFMLNVRRYLRLRDGRKSHFKGQEHHSSKTVR